MATRAAQTDATGEASKHSDSMRETFESIITAFLLAFVFRAFVVEAFVIPTGSMAPTLLGEHIQQTCQECGYEYDVQCPGAVRVDANNLPKPWLTTTLATQCPMCHNRNEAEPGTRLRPGDRILVHKYIYSLPGASPTRWDVVVFKNPTRPHQNFIKRLVGLPDEQLWIIEGNVYVRPSRPDARWRIARKTDRVKVQREVWQPVYHSRFYPLDEGVDPRRVRWTMPWRPARDDNWSMEAGFHYAYLDTSGEGGEIRFDFAAQDLRYGMGDTTNASSRYPYNAASLRYNNDRRLAPETIEDVRIAATIIPRDPNVGVHLTTTARLDAAANVPEPFTIRARITPKGEAVLEAYQQGSPVRELSRESVPALEADAPRDVELWHVDQAIRFWVDGRVVGRWDYEVPIEQLESRPPADPYPQITLGVAGGQAELHHVQVDRDLYYSSRQAPGSTTPGLGTLIKQGSRRYGEALTIGSRQYFCLGDNSPYSSDGRYWSDPVPWIRQRYFQDQDQLQGVVPDELMLGRAFFVYFPAPYSPAEHMHGFLPNFGDMRFIH